MENITLSGARLGDARRSLLTLLKFWDRAFSGQPVSFFSTFIVSICSIILFPFFRNRDLVVSSINYSRNHELLKLHNVSQKFCVAMLVAMLVVALKLVVGLGDRTVEKLLSWHRIEKKLIQGEETINQNINSNKTTANYYKRCYETNCNINYIVDEPLIFSKEKLHKLENIWNCIENKITFQFNKYVRITRRIIRKWFVNLIVNF